MEDGAEECALCNDGDQLRPRLSSRERLWRPSEGGRSSRTATQKDRPIHRQLADWLTSKSFALFRVPQENSAAPQSCWMSKGRNHRTSFSRLLRSCSETLQREGDSDDPIGSGAGGRLHGPPGLFFSPPQPEGRQDTQWDSNTSA